MDAGPEGLWLQASELVNELEAVFVFRYGWCEHGESQESLWVGVDTTTH